MLRQSLRRPAGAGFRVKPRLRLRDRVRAVDRLEIYAGSRQLSVTEVQARQILRDMSRLLPQTFDGLQLSASLPDLWVVIDKLRAAQKISRRLLDREITI